MWIIFYNNLLKCVYFVVAMRSVLNYRPRLVRSFTFRVLFVFILSLF